MAEKMNALSMKSGDRGTIAALDTANIQRARKLMALGILPGMPLKVIQKYPTWVLQVGNTQAALDDDCMSCIMIDPEK